MKAQILTPNPGSLALAADAIQRGEVVGMPTETVYGLAGNAFNPQALARIFAVKERPTFDPLIIHVGLKIRSIEDLARLGLVHCSAMSQEAVATSNRLISSFWPGPLTLVLPKTSLVPDLATSGLSTVAVRMPGHPIAQALIAACGVPLAAPSANRFGRISPTSADDVLDELGDRIEIILNGGQCSVGLESTIVSIEPWGETSGELTLLRPGGLSREKIELLLEKPLLTGSSSKILAPGMLPSHYAPKKKLTVFKPGFQTQAISARAALLIVTGSPGEAAARFKKATGLDARVYSLSVSGDLEEAARALFSTLRAMDESDCDALFFEEFSVTQGLGFAISDRLKRASS